MATRCSIIVEGVDLVKIYKHWDGYPSNMVAWLSEFNQDFKENRGVDAPYKFAQLLRSSIRDNGKYALDDSPYTGWGVFPMDTEMGEDFEYTLHTDGSVTSTPKQL